ncbi:MULTISPECIES: hypothetical protein [Myroides]|uniref:Peptidylprolyl isomerase n=1 Tax=Myroides albus TaxID=2562892 RepID=A0A6I3LF90_9FLAO|nr:MULTISPECIES: hypothetical protein [Myroides]MTG97128.1 hypothetical protein [Myroides albus]MVX35139.1 hypothetical protein [Myroides sp. LoEW2-1]UVD78870.1 hypothetical protein NWE55_12170 [Myroides albus]
MTKFKKKCLQLCFLSLSALVAYSCDGKDAETKNNMAARVNNTYLAKDKLEDIVPVKVTGKDSLAFVHRFIDKWATKQLLIEAAQLNLPEDKVVEIDQLVENFKSDLSIKAYLELLVQNKIDTIISDNQLKEYYESYKSNFLVDDMLVQLAYVNVLNDNTNFATIKRKFNSTKSSEINSLENLSLQMKSYFLNDDVWIEVGNIYERLPFITLENRRDFLRSNYSFEYSAESSTYFVRVKSVIPKGGIIPFEFIKKSLRSLIINDRKVELMKQIQEDIIKDAKNNKRYEIF